MQKPKPVLFNKKYITKHVQKHLFVTVNGNGAAGIHRNAKCFNNKK